MADRILKPDSGNDLVLQNDDGSGKIEINENASIPVTGTLDVSGATLTTSSAQKQAIVQAGPGSGTLDVSSGTFTTSSAQKTAIVDGGKGNLTASDVGLGNVTNESKATMFTSPTFSGTPNLGTNPNITLGSNAAFPVAVTDKTLWYRGFSATGASQQIGPYACSNNLDNGSCFLSGTAPDGFDSLTAIEAWFLSSGSDPGNTTVTFEWNVATDGQANSTHVRTISGRPVATGFGASTIRKCDLKNAANDGNDFEDNIQQNDVWGIKLTGSNVAASFYLIGLKITWRYG
jgi:hypothetical protein